MSSDFSDPGSGVRPPPTPSAYTRPPKSPGLALLLSLIVPGLGQFYNGQVAKALVFFCAFVTSLYLLVDVSAFPYALVVPFVIFANLVDAYKTATLINAGAAGSATASLDAAPESPAWGGSLMLVGLVLLAHNLEWINLAALHRYWPVLFIIIGAVLLYRSFKKQQRGGY